MWGLYNRFCSRDEMMDKAETKKDWDKRSEADKLITHLSLRLHCEGRHHDLNKDPYYCQETDCKLAREYFFNKVGEKSGS